MAKKQLQTSIPGVGFIFKPKYKDRHGVLQESSNWTIRLADGTQRSTYLEDQQAAYAELVKLAGQQAAGTLIKTRGTIAELLDLALEDAKAKGNRSLADKKGKLEILRAAFGSTRIADFRRHHAEEWLKRARLPRPGQKNVSTDQLSDASKNRYMGELKRAFRLGTEMDPPLCGRIPKLPRFEEDNVRQGMLDKADYKRMRDAFIADHARLFFVIAYHVGMRSGEILRLRWDQVDLDKKLIRLEIKQTKGKAARVAPIYGEMIGYLDLAKQSRSAGCDRVIQFEGKPVHSIKRSWATACRVANIGLIPHDMRRTAVTNMIAAGIPAEEVMQIVGHKTNSMLRRYMISNEGMAIRAGQKLEAWAQQQNQYKTLVQDGRAKRPN